MNIKVIAAELVGGALILVFLFNLFLSQTSGEFLTRLTLLIFVFIFGVLLIRSVIQEVRTREEMEKLAGDLAIANEKLKELDKAKSDFVSIASHQLRTPVTAIKGYSSMLLEGSFGEIPEKAKSATEKIFESSNRLVHLITDFLTLSRIERGKIEYDFQKTDLKAIVVSVMDEFKAANIKDKKNLDLSLDIAENEDYALNIDQEKIRQVIYNIIENAMKYTPRGFIKVSLSKTPDKSKVVLGVQDSGIGMNKESLGKIFRKFGQAGENGKIETTSGVGLGLYVAKEIMKAHNGEIRAESKGEGRGSAFYIELPVNFEPPAEK
jgi:signal transduction histidine kinase